jgi:hypothetical protein
MHKMEPCASKCGANSSMQYTNCTNFAGLYSLTFFNNSQPNIEIFLILKCCMFVAYVLNAISVSMYVIGLW